MAKKKLVGPITYVLFLKPNLERDEIKESGIKYDFIVACPENGKEKQAKIDGITYLSKQICYEKRANGEFVISKAFNEQYVRNLISCKKVLALPTDTDLEIFETELAKKILKDPTPEACKIFTALAKSIKEKQRKFLAQG